MQEGSVPRGFPCKKPTCVHLLETFCFSRGFPCSRVSRKGGLLSLQREELPRVWRAGVSAVMNLQKGDNPARRVIPSSLERLTTKSPCAKLAFLGRHQMCLVWFGVCYYLQHITSIFSCFTQRLSNCDIV